MPEVGTRFLTAIFVVVFLLVMLWAAKWIQSWPWEPDCSLAATNYITGCNYEEEGGE